MESTVVFAEPMHEVGIEGVEGFFLQAAVHGHHHELSVLVFVEAELQELFESIQIILQPKARRDNKHKKLFQLKAKQNYYKLSLNLLNVTPH